MELSSRWGPWWGDELWTRSHVWLPVLCLCACTCSCTAAHVFTSTHILYIAVSGRRFHTLNKPAAIVLCWGYGKAFNQAVKTGVAKQVMHFPDQGFFFFPSLESFKSPYEVLSSSYGRIQLILLNLTGESLPLGKDQKPGLQLYFLRPPDWPLHRAEKHPIKSWRLENMLINVNW